MSETTTLTEPKAEIPAEPRRLKLIAWMDGPDVESGFGTVSENLLLGLIRKGWEVVAACGINSEGLPDRNFPFPIYPAMHVDPQGDYCGRVRFLKFVDRVPNFDVCLMLQDSFQISHDVRFEHDTRPFVDDVIRRVHGRGGRTVLYFPVDGDPWPAWFRGFEFADGIVTYTHWGRRQVELQAPELAGKIQVIYHGCDPDFYGAEIQPGEPDREDLRLKYFPRIQDRFLVLWVGTNQRRKRLPVLLESFQSLIRDFRVPATLVLRTSVDNPGLGWNLPNCMKNLGLGPDEVVFVERGVPRPALRNLYRACDVYCHLPMEGWGLPITEAMAAGLPCVLAKHSSLQEIGADGRALLVPAKQYDVLHADYEVPRWNPDPVDVARALKEVWAKPEEARAMADRARAWCSEHSWDHVVDQWDDLLRQVVRQPTT